MNAFINIHWIKLKDWWATLALREQRVVAAGGAVIAFLFLYAAIWLPTLNHLDNMRKQISSDQKALLTIQAINQDIQKIENEAKNKTKASSAINLLTAMQAKIQEARLEPNLRELKQISNDIVQVQFQNVDFDRVIRLLIIVCKEQGASITQMSAVAESSPGTVNMNVSLKL